MDKKKLTPEELREKIVRDFEFSYERLLEYKRYKFSPVIINKDGEIIEIPPKERPAIPISSGKASFWDTPTLPLAFSNPFY